MTKKRPTKKSPTPNEETAITLRREELARARRMASLARAYNVAAKRLTRQLQNLDQTRVILARVLLEGTEYDVIARCEWDRLSDVAVALSQQLETEIAKRVSLEAERRAALAVV